MPVLPHAAGIGVGIFDQIALVVITQLGAAYRTGIGGLAGLFQPVGRGVGGVGRGVESAGRHVPPAVIAVILREGRCGPARVRAADFRHLRDTVQRIVLIGVFGNHPGRVIHIQRNEGIGARDIAVVSNVRCWRIRVVTIRVVIAVAIRQPNGPAIHGAGVGAIVTDARVHHLQPRVVADVVEQPAGQPITDIIKIKVSEPVLFQNNEQVVFIFECMASTKFIVNSIIN